MVTLSYFVIPLCIIFSMFFSLKLLAEWIEDQYIEGLLVIICCPCFFLLWALGVVIFSGLGIFMLMFVNTSFIGLFIRDKLWRFKYVTRLQVNEMVNMIVSFINHNSTNEESELYSYPDNDKVIRILSVNQAYHMVKYAGMSYSDDRFFKFINGIIEKHSWDKVTQKDIMTATYSNYYKKKEITTFRYQFLNKYAEFVLYTYGAGMFFL